MPRIKLSKEESDQSRLRAEAEAALDLPVDKRDEGLQPAPKKKSTTKKDINKVLKDIKEVETKKPKSTKSITKTIKQIENITKAPKTKKLKSTKEISGVLDLVGEISKKPKNKKLDIESIAHQIAEVEKLLKASPKDLKKLVKADKEHLKYHPSDMDKKELKLDTKIMKQSKGYNHKINSISPAAQDYVDQYISIYKNTTSPPARGRLINKLKLNVYTKLRPSDLDDVNKLIGEFKEGLEPKTKTKATPKQQDPDVKKKKAIEAYVLKNKPESITDQEDIDMIVSDLYKADQRMSKKLLLHVLKDIGYIE